MVGQETEPVEVIQIAVHADFVFEHACKDVEAMVVIEMTIRDEIVEVTSHWREKKIDESVSIAECDRDVRLNRCCPICLHATIVECHVFTYAIIPCAEEQCAVKISKQILKSRIEQLQAHPAEQSVEHEIGCVTEEPAHDRVEFYLCPHRDV